MWLTICLFFGVGGSGRRPSRMCKYGNGSVGPAGWCIVVPSIGCQLIDSRLGSGLISSVIAILAPLRHASNLGGRFPLCNLLPAVSWGPPEGATTHHLYFNKICLYFNKVYLYFNKVCLYFNKVYLYFNKVYLYFNKV